MEDLLKNREEFLDETCSLCGRQLTKYGNKKLKDGTLCRICAKVSSPWLSDEDFSRKTVEDMRKHIIYRGQNLAKLDTFVCSKVVEGKYSLYLDEENRQLYFAKKKDVKRENPDIIPFDDVEEISIVEEKYLNEDAADLMFEVKLNNDELSRMYFRVNEFPGINTQSEEYAKTSELADNYLKALMEDMDFEEVTQEV